MRANLRQTQSGNSGKDRGVAAVELALILPVLGLLLLGACDFGRFAHTQIAVSNAARAAAAQAGRNRPTPASQSQWEAGIRQAAQDELEGLADFKAERMTVEITAAAESGGTLRAQVQVHYPFNTLVNWTAIPNEFACQETVSFRVVQ